MSVRIMTAVWTVNLPDSEKIVLLALADCANDEGLCWPSMATLAAKCSKSDRTVQAAIKSLVSSGHMSRSEVPGKGCRYIIGFAPEGNDANPRSRFGQTIKNHHLFGGFASSETRTASRAEGQTASPACGLETDPVR